MAENIDWSDKATEIPHPRDMKETERLCGVLERVAKLFPPGSEESEAIAEAAGAVLWLGLHENLRAAYDKFRSVAGEDSLSKGQKARMSRQLREMGIEPEESEHSS